jgi:hypothetical protein
MGGRRVTEWVGRLSATCEFVYCGFNLGERSDRRDKQNKTKKKKNEQKNNGKKATHQAKANVLDTFVTNAMWSAWKRLQGCCGTTATAADQPTASTAVMPTTNNGKEILMRRKSNVCVKEKEERERGKGKRKAEMRR